jgi:hypothetical protein
MPQTVYILRNNKPAFIHACSAVHGLTSTLLGTKNSTNGFVDDINYQVPLYMPHIVISQALQ